MMATLVDIDSDALLYSEPDRQAIRHIERGISRLSSLDGLRDASKEMLSSMRSKFERTSGQMAKMLKRTALRRSATELEGELNYFRNIGSVALANIKTQDYLLALPRVKSAALAGEISAWGREANSLPDGLGESDYMYRRATDTMVREVTDDDGVVTVVARNYLELLKSEDQLDTTQQTEVAMMWESVANAMDRDEDPTDPYVNR
ncbi:MAG: hypothetical protein KAG66_04250 [Methylococcales bacterium]|nr:hypothetical protein [Methylococcales bacterium]